MWHSAIMTEIATATEIATETEIGTETMIATEIADTTTTGCIAITTGTEMTAECIATAMIGAMGTGVGEMTGDMIAAMTATIGAGMEDAGFTGTGTSGFTNQHLLRR
jgi:hypothetical protein